MTRLRVSATSIVLIATFAAITPVAASAAAPLPDVLTPNVRPASIELLTARVDYPNGNHVLQGKTEAMRVTLHNTGFESAKNVGFHIDTPKGTSVSTPTKNWKCSQTRSREGFRCNYDGIMNSETDVTIRLNVKTTLATPDGVDSIHILPFSSSSKKITSHHSSFTVVDGGDAIMRPIVQHRVGKKWKTWDNGSHHEAHVHDVLSYRVVVSNRGVVPLTKDSKMVLTQTVDKKIPVQSVTISSGRGTCSTTNGEIRCELLATEDIEPGDRLATVDINIAITKEYERLPLGSIHITNPVSGAKHSDSFKVKTTYRPDSIVITADNRIQPDAGGKGEIDLQLKNGKNGIHHGTYTLSARLPKAINFTRADGKDWQCGMKGQILTCAYSAALPNDKTSSVAKISFTAAKDARVNGEGYEIDFTSQHAVSRLWVSVLPAVSINAAAVPTTLKTSTTTRRNMVLLTAEGSELHGTALQHTWVQRCTTQADSRAYAGCTDGVVTPKASINSPAHTRTHAFLPNVSKNTTFVFEFIAQNTSSELHRTVKVTAKASAAVNTASSDSTWSDGTVSAQGVSSFGLMPAWFEKAMNDGGMTDVVYTSTNGIISASAKLPTLLREQLKVPGDTPVNVTAIESEPDKCAVVHVGTTDAASSAKNALSVATVGLKGKYFDYVIAGSGCSYQNKSYSGLSIVFRGKVFDNDLNFSGSVTLWPTFRYDATASVESLVLSAAKTSFTLKNTIVSLTVDQATVSATLGLGGRVNVFGEELELFGTVGLPSNDAAAGAAFEGMEVKLTMRSPRTYTSGEVSIKDLSFSLGVRWTPILSNRVDASIVTNIYISVSGTGTIEFMGTTLKISQIEADFRGNKINNILFKFSADLSLSGMKTVYGTISVMWQAPLPAEADKSAEPAYWSVDAMVLIESDSGFTIGTVEEPARLTYRNACIKVTGRVIVPEILDATVSGVFVTANPCFPAIGDFVSAAVATKGSSILTELPLPVVRGDWRFDASDVKINIGDFDMTGDFSIGRVLGVPFGALDANIHLTKSDKKNTIYVKGELNPLLLTAKFKGTANLSVGGVSGDFAIDAVLTPLTQRISASASTTVAGVTVALSGSFGIEFTESTSTYTPGKPKSTQASKKKKIPTPYAEFTASVDNFGIDGFRLGSAAFEWHESVESAGFSASMHVTLGSINVTGELVVNESRAGIGTSLHADGDLKISDKWEADLSFDMSNCQNDDCTKLGAFKISASGNAVLAGKSFHLGTFSFDTGGHFRFKTDFSGGDCDSSGNISGVEYEACFYYSIHALLTDTSPYLNLDADVSGSIKSRTRCTTCNPKRWRGWDNWGSFSAGISIRFDPFHLSYRNKTLGITFSV